MNIMKIFFESPAKEFGVREVGRKAKISPATASKYLKRFSKEKILLRRKEHNLELFRADIESDSYRDIKLYYTIRKLRNSGLLRSLDEFYIKPAVVLFGSASFGTDTETSDIDIVVISERKDEFPEKGKFEKKFGKEIQMFAVSDLRELKNEHLINSVLNGIVIQGEIRWI